MASGTKFILAWWAVFVVVWLAAAAFTKRTARAETWQMGAKYRLPTALGILLMLDLPRVYPLSLVVVPRAFATAFAGNVLCLAGLLLAIWARLTLGRNWSSSVTLKQEHELVGSGPYRFVRHPIYSAILVMLAGTAIVLGRLSSILALIPFFVGFYVKLRLEEEVLSELFPRSYECYRRRVAALVPFVI